MLLIVAQEVKSVSSHCPSKVSDIFIFLVYLIKNKNNQYEYDDNHPPGCNKKKETGV